MVVVKMERSRGACAVRGSGGSKHVRSARIAASEKAKKSPRASGYNFPQQRSSVSAITAGVGALFGTVV